MCLQICHFSLVRVYPQRKQVKVTTKSPKKTKTNAINRKSLVSCRCRTLVLTKRTNMLLNPLHEIAKLH